MSVPQKRKVVIVGDSGTGKTSIINKYLNLNMSTTPTVASASYKISVHLGEDDIYFNLWDTAGQENYKCLVPVYARGAHVAIIVFDQSNRSSFENVEFWYNYLYDDIGVKNILLVSNKEDLPAEVAFEEMLAWATDHNISCISTSAETGLKLDMLFQEVAKFFVGNNLRLSDTIPEPVVQMTTKNEKKNNCC